MLYFQVSRPPARRRIGSARFVRYRLVLAIAIGTATSPLIAQTKTPDAWSFGFAMGTPIVGAPLFRSPIAIGRATWRPSGRFNLRGEASVANFASAGGDFTVTVPPCPTTCPVASSPKPPTSFGGLSGHLIVNDDYIVRGETGGYYVLGGGMYRALSPSSVGSIGGAIETGIGYRFSDCSFEVKYVHIRHWTVRQLSFVPITVGFSW
jgi:hypothetical protein